MEREFSCWRRESPRWLFRLVPALDRAFPPLLELTRMQPPHSLLHIVTGLLALAVLRWGGPRGCFGISPPCSGRFTPAWRFSAWPPTTRRRSSCKAFDHPFHLALGLAGLACAAFSYVPAFARRAVAMSRP